MVLLNNFKEIWMPFIYSTFGKCTVNPADFKQLYRMWLMFSICDFVNDELHELFSFLLLAMLVILINKSGEQLTFVHSGIK